MYSSLFPPISPNFFVCPPNISEKLTPVARPPGRRLSRPPAAISATPASRPRKMRLSRETAEKNNRLSRREKCGLITEKSNITVFNICKLQCIRHGLESPSVVGAVMFSLRLCIKRTYMYFHCTAVKTNLTHDLTLMLMHYCTFFAV